AASAAVAAIAPQAAGAAGAADGLVAGERAVREVEGGIGHRETAGGTDAAITTTRPSPTGTAVAADGLVVREDTGAHSRHRRRAVNEERAALGLAAAATIEARTARSSVAGTGGVVGEGAAGNCQRTVGADGAAVAGGVRTACQPFGLVARERAVGNGGGAVL